MLKALANSSPGLRFGNPGDKTCSLFIGDSGQMFLFMPKNYPQITLITQISN